MRDLFSGFNIRMKVRCSFALNPVIIPQVWVKAAVDAHKKLGFSETGNWVAGMDVAGIKVRCSFALNPVGRNHVGSWVISILIF
jgi:hypothetical protein